MAVKSRLIAGLLATVLLSGCAAMSATPTPRPTPTPTPPPVLLRLAAEFELAPIVEPLVDEHRAIAPRTVIDFSQGTPAQLYEGIDAATLDLALIPRMLTPEDDRATMLHSDLPVVVVHESNALDGLTTLQLQQLLTGWVTTWSDLGARAGRPEILAPHAGTTLRTVIDERMLTGEARVTSAALLMPDGWVTAEYVAKHDNAVGIALLGQITPGCKVLALDGVTPTWETFDAGEYPLALGWEAVFETYAPPEADEVLADIRSRGILPR